MGARMGRPPWYDRCPELLPRIREALAARAQSAAAIYAELNLRRFLSLSRFREWVAGQRRVQEHRLIAGATTAGAAAAGEAATGGDAGASPWSTPASPSSASGVSLLGQCLDAMSTEVAAGRAKVYELAQVLRAVVNLEQLRLAEQAEQRATELHEIKLAELRKRQAAALETVTTTTRLTPEQVVAIREQVLGL